MKNYNKSYNSYVFLLISFYTFMITIRRKCLITNKCQLFLLLIFKSYERVIQTCKTHV